MWRKLIGVTAGLVAGLGLVLVLGRCQQGAGPLPQLGAAVSETQGPLAEVWLQYTSQSEPVVGTAQADFLFALEPRTHVRVTLAGPEEARSFQDFLERHGLVQRMQGRLTVVRTAGPLTPWTRDRALALGGQDTNLTLLVPPAPADEWPERRNDWQASWMLGKTRPASRVVQLPLDFDGGDLVLLDGEALFDANLLAKNTNRGFHTAAELTRAVAQWTGRPAHMLGTAEGDVPKYHMAMYAMPIGNHKVLVGDPSLARALTGTHWQPGDASVETDEPLRADDTPQTQARFDEAARALRAQGWDVVRIPVVQFDDRTYMTYTNAVLESVGTHRVVYLPVYGANALDDAASRTWLAQGYEIRPIRVAGVWRHHGTIGCLVNVLQRGR